MREILQIGTAGGSDLESSPSQPCDFDCEVPGEGGADHIPLANRDADQRQCRRRASGGEGVVGPTVQRPAPWVRRLTSFGDEVVKNVGQVSRH